MLNHDHKYSDMKDEMKNAYREARLKEQKVKRKRKRGSHGGDANATPVAARSAFPRTPQSAEILARFQESNSEMFTDASPVYLEKIVELIGVMCTNNFLHLDLKLDNFMV